MSEHPIETVAIQVGDMFYSIAALERALRAAGCVTHNGVWVVPPGVAGWVQPMHITIAELVRRVNTKDQGV